MYENINKVYNHTVTRICKSQFLLEEWSTEPLVKDPVTYEQLEQIYDTLYPVADGYFITHNNNYWGVVDSSGAVFLCPFGLMVSPVDGQPSSCALRTAKPFAEYGHPTLRL